MHNLPLFASSLLLVFVTNCGLTLASLVRDTAFDPLAFDQYWQVASCPGINRAENKTIGLRLRMLP